MQAKDAIDAIEDGNETVKEIAEYLDLHPNNVGKQLKRIAEDPGNPVDREPEGRGHRYYINEDLTSGDAAEATPVAGGRDYDWEEYLPDPNRVPAYEPFRDEWDGINDEIDFVQEWLEDHPDPESWEDAAWEPRLPHFKLEGPTGSAKTTLFKSLALERGWPVFTLQVAYQMDKSDIVGSARLRAGETVWQDEVLVKAMLASQDRPVVLIVDEANRAPPRAKSALFESLDFRCAIELKGRGGEVIEGNPFNLIVGATINKGPGYHVEPIDKAEKRRYGNTWEVGYLGMAPENEDGVSGKEREADLIASKSPASKRLAELMVEAANAIREKAEDPTSDVRSGLPVDYTISWAQTAAARHHAGRDNPVVKAAQAAVIDSYYDERQEEADEVFSVITSHLDGVPFERDELNEWAGGASERVTCMNCDYTASIEEAENAGVLDWMECPECNHDVKRIGGGE